MSISLLTMQTIAVVYAIVDLYCLLPDYLLTMFVRLIFRMSDYVVKELERIVVVGVSEHLQNKLSITCTCD